MSPNLYWKKVAILGGHKLHVSAPICGNDCFFNYKKKSCEKRERGEREWREEETR